MWRRVSWLRSSKPLQRRRRRREVPQLCFDNTTTTTTNDVVLFVPSSIHGDSRRRSTTTTTIHSNVLWNHHWNGPYRFFSSSSLSSSSSKCDDRNVVGESELSCGEVMRLRKLRNVGVLAHVDAGKTTVTERMLALSGVVTEAGNVDDGNTVTDYLPAERERGITIQSAAISFDWNDDISVQLIDTPGHVDFTVEVNRSVAVLDGAILLIDAVAGVQAQTETVWRATTTITTTTTDSKDHPNSALPCLAFVNKMDKEGCNFHHALQTMRQKLPNANPLAIQIPLFLKSNTTTTIHNNNIHELQLSDLVTQPVTTSDNSNNHNHDHGPFVGVVDLIEMRAILWPEVSSQHISNVELCVPRILPLTDTTTTTEVGKIAWEVRNQYLFAGLAEVDDEMEEMFLLEEQLPTTEQLKAACRRATLQRRILPTLAGAALRAKGVEPLLDAIAQYLPSPLDVNPPPLQHYNNHNTNKKSKHDKKKKKKDDDDDVPVIPFGHALHPSLLALAFKVVHMKGRGGSGDGRVVFCRIYSGTLRTRDTLKVISPPPQGETTISTTTTTNNSSADPQHHQLAPRTERVAGMLQLNGGRFDNISDGICHSGDVCALVGLKSVVTGDTLLLATNNNNNKNNNNNNNNKVKFENVNFGGGGKKNSSHASSLVCLAGVASPKPVLTIRLEAQNSAEQAKLVQALQLMVVEDPSLHIQEDTTATLLSGLGELHMEVVLDRLQREHGLANIWSGPPSVSYRETITSPFQTIDPNTQLPGLYTYHRTIGNTTMQASIHLSLQPYSTTNNNNNDDNTSSSCQWLTEPIVTIGSKARQFLNVDEDISEDQLLLQQQSTQQSSSSSSSSIQQVIQALIYGCRGALQRGPVGSYAMANVHCHIIDIDAEGGLASLIHMPGSIRAAASVAISTTLQQHSHQCTVLEPTMNLEVTVPKDMVGAVLSDITTRRGHVGDVLLSDTTTKARIQADAPLVEILGYASSLRSLTAGEGTFSAEYKGHSPSCDK